MNDRRPELLLTYTVFHIGVYLSLATALMGVIPRTNEKDYGSGKAAYPSLRSSPSERRDELVLTAAA